MTQAASATVLTASEIRSVIAGLMLSVFVGAIDQTIVSVALPRMSAELHGFDLLAWVVSGYLVAVAVATPIYGKLGDLYGRRMMLSSALCLFLAASIACAMATSMPMLVAARIVQGLGGGGLVALAQAAVGDVVAPRERGRYQVYFSVTYASASVSGPLLGGLLTHYLSWRWVFWINLPLCLAAIFISRRALALLPVPHIKRPIDFLGASLLSAGLAALLIGVTRIGQGVSWSAPGNLQLFGLALLVLALFVWQQQASVEPILPLGLFRLRAVTLCCAIQFIAFFQIISLTVLMPLRTQMMTGAGAGMAAIQLVPLSLTVSLSSFLAGRIMTRTGRFKVCQLSGAAVALLALMGLLFSDPAHVVQAYLLLALMGAGTGLQFSSGIVGVQNAVPPRHIGVATATVVFFRSLGGAIGVAVLTALLLVGLREHAPALWSSAGSEVDLLKELIGGTTAAIGAEAHFELMASVRSTFQTVLTVNAAAAALSLMLALLLRDDILRSAAAPDPDA
jgi:EmrB/QacA subfamily drug resistance transporter